MSLPWLDVVYFFSAGVRGVSCRNQDREINDFNQSLRNFRERLDNHDKTVDDASEMKFFIRSEGSIGDNLWLKIPL